MVHALDTVAGESEWSASPGLIAEADVTRYGGLEIALFYIRQRYVQERDGRILKHRVKRIHITTGYRHWFTKWYSAAAAFSSSYSMGDADVLRDDFTNRNRPTTSAGDTTEYGIDFSMQAEPWSRGRYAVVVDARYNFSLTPKPKEDANHYGLFVGVKYFIQSPRPMESVSN